MPECELFREAIFDYVNGSLESGELQGFRRHFEACPTCAEALRTIESQEAALAALPRPKAPDTLWPGIRQALADRALLCRVERPRRRTAGWLAVAAALVAAAAGVIALTGRARREKPGLPVRVVDVSMRPGAGLIGRMVPAYEDPDASARILEALLERDR